MLQSIRDHTQGWIAGVIVSLLILSFALWGIHSYFEGGQGNTNVAKVNGTEISKDQLVVAYERLRRQLQIQYNSNYQLPEQAELGLKEKALHSLIDMQVLKQASLAENYRISTHQVDGFLANMPEFQQNGQFSIERFQKLLETTMYSANDFLGLIEASLLIDQPRMGLMLTSFALPYEVNSAIALINQERNIQYLVLPPNSVSNQPTISQDVIQSYYNQHQNEFKTPEQVTIEYVELSIRDIMAGIHPNDEVLRKFYTENKSSFTEPKQWQLTTLVIPLTEKSDEKEIAQAHVRANEILTQAKKGKEFSSLANKYSLKSLDNKLNGWLKINQVPVELQQSILTLNQVGQITSPVKTPYGYILIKASGIKESVIPVYDQVKNKVRDSLARQQAEEKFAEKREKLANIAYEHPDSLEPVAKSINLAIKTSEPFSKDKGGNDVSKNSKVREIAFSNDVLNLRNNSDVITDSSDTAFVIRIKNHTTAATLPLKEVENRIINKLKTVKIQSQISQLANGIKQKLESGASLESVAHEYHLNWKKTGFIGRHSKQIDSALLEKTFEMPIPQKVKMSYATTKVTDGYAVIALSAVRNGVASNNEQYQVFAEQLEMTQGLMEYELYKQSAIEQAKIVIY